MNKSIDKELNNKGGLLVTEGPLLPFERSEQFIYIPCDIIKDVSLYMAIVISKATSNRNVHIEVIFKNAKNMFRDGVRYHDDLWMQHCAASMREILSFVRPFHFNQAFGGIPLPTDPNVESTFKFFAYSNAYLSSIVHFRESARVGEANNLYPNQGYGQNDQDEFLRSEQIFFEKVCIDIVYTLHHLFTQYCGRCLETK